MVLETEKGLNKADGQEIKETWLWDVLHKTYVSVEKSFENLQVIWRRL